MSVSSEFKKRIVKLVDDCEYNRTELRTKLKISSTTFINAVVYGILPTPKTLLELANFFDVSFNYLLGKCASNDLSPAVKNISFQERFTELCQKRSVAYYEAAWDCGSANCLIARWLAKGYLP